MSFTEYTDTVEQSGEYLRLALDYMGQFSIPVDPVNYTVWYEYVSGRNNKLREEIDRFLKYPGRCTVKVCKDLYRRYIAEGQGDVVEEMRQEIRRILAEILKHIMDAGGEVSRYGEVLETYADELVDNLDADEIRNIVDRIILETKSMEESGARLKKRLMATTQEVEALRKDLEKVRKDATTDTLTGLANRRYFEEVLEREARDASALGKPLCLIMADIDKFKRINDTYGHLVGDKVLKITASMIKDSVKGRDLVARYGGEEFVIILSDTPIQGARTVAEKMREYFASTRMKRKDTGEFIGTVTLSFGVAKYRDGEPLEEFIQRADKALYVSKDNGRNLVTTEEALPG